MPHLDVRPTTVSPPDLLSARTRQVITLAQEEARILGHCYLGTEHLLMGLLDEGNGDAFAELTQRGLDRGSVHVATGELVGVGRTLTGRFIALTPRARTVFERARLDAETYGLHRIEPEHILQHLFDDRRSVASRVVDRLARSSRNTNRPLPPPACPRCSASLTHNVKTAMACWTTGTARILYCGECGHTFGVLPAS